MAYPEGTPPHGPQILTDHIKVCEKHPMRKAEERIAKLRCALIGLVGSSDPVELGSMEAMIRTVPDSVVEKAAAINAIRVLIDTTEGI
jgi:hypothetical protein